MIFQQAGKWYVVFVGRVSGVYDSWAEAHGQTTDFTHNSFKGYETEVEARKAYSTYLKKCDGSSSKESDGSHDQQPLAHQLKIALEQRDKLKEELDDLRAKLVVIVLDTFALEVTLWYEKFVTMVLFKMVYIAEGGTIDRSQDIADFFYVTMTPALPLRTTLLKSKVLGSKGKEALSASTQTIGIEQKGDFPGQECHDLSAFAYASLEAAFQSSSTVPPSPVYVQQQLLDCNQQCSSRQLD
ncbi:hypothetical protein RHGRI_001278 [Rhododendron griersonianum]|uniref:Ribonuclease H1 N-terminal domain-containing protein n=1 Tax=Rhododendron griersonianum TaxID=479676 RepID=A0AAV6LK26_9ERIC|nr:hypothetical protein RHGRI_001278 [Rhododendron griersonianum]